MKGAGGGQSTPIRGRVSYDWFRVNDDNNNEFARQRIERTNMQHEERMGRAHLERERLQQRRRQEQLERERLQEIRRQEQLERERLREEEERRREERIRREPLERERRREEERDEEIRAQTMNPILRQIQQSQEPRVPDPTNIQWEHEAHPHINGEILPNEIGILDELLDQIQLPEGEIDENMREAIAVAENFDAMNEREQNIQQQQAEGGGGRLNRFQHGLRNPDNVYIRPKVTSSGQYIPSNVNEPYLTASQRSLNYRDISRDELPGSGYDNVEEYRANKLSKVPGTWRYDRRQREIEERNKGFREEEEKRRVADSSVDTPPVREPPNLAYLSYRTLLNGPASKKKLKQLKELSNIPDEQLKGILHRIDGNIDFKNITDEQLKQHFNRIDGNINEIRRTIRNYQHNLLSAYNTRHLETLRNVVEP